MKAFVALLALAAVPANAHASSSCGGSSGGSSSSGGGSSSGGSSSGDSGGGWDSSSSSSDSGTSTSTTTVICDDSDEPVGFRTCTRFAQWSGSSRFPRLILGLGTVVRQTPSLARGQTGHVTHADEGFTYRMVDTGDGGAAEDTAVMATMRIGFGVSKHLYAAGDFEVGGITSAAPGAEMTSTGTRGSPTITGQVGIAANMLGVVGARTGRGRNSLAIEAAGGVHVVSYAYQSQYIACQQQTSISGAAPLLEVRASAEHWLNPWINVGATVGGSVIDRGAWMTGVYFGISTRAFGGER